MSGKDSWAEGTVRDRDGSGVTELLRRADDFHINNALWAVLATARKDRS